MTKRKRKRLSPAARRAAEALDDQKPEWRRRMERYAEEQAAKTDNWFKATGRKVRHHVKRLKTEDGD